MKLGDKEQKIIDFLEEPASEELILSEFSPHRSRSREQLDTTKTHQILRRLIAKGLITRKGDTFYKS